MFKLHLGAETVNQKMTLQNSQRRIFKQTHTGGKTLVYILSVTQLSEGV